MDIGRMQLEFYMVGEYMDYICGRLQGSARIIDKL